MKRSFLLIVFVIIALLATIVLARQQTTNANKTREKNHTTSETRERDTQPSAYEYLVLVGGRSNLTSAGGNPSLSKLSLDSSFRENYPLERNLDKLGAEGWELITVIAPPQGDPVYYLKRAKDASK